MMSRTWSAFILRSFIVVCVCAGLVQLAEAASEGNMSYPLLIGSAIPTTDEFGNKLVGNAYSAVGSGDLIQILWAPDGIYPPLTNGAASAENQVIAETFVGSQTAPSLTAPSIFSIALPDGKFQTFVAPIFVRIFNAPTTDQATYYGDSALIQYESGVTRALVTIPATGLAINPASARADTDEDGMDDEAERFAGTNPNNENSVLAVQYSSAAGENIQWAAIPGVIYTVEQNQQSLLEPVWYPVYTVTATTSSIEFDIPNAVNETVGYFRIRVDGNTNL